MTKIKTKVSTNWQTFKGRILIHCAVGTADVCNEGALSKKSDKHKCSV